MKIEKYSSIELYNYLILNKIAPIDDLKKVLGTNTDKTVIRKLKQISYRTSYSHRGKYYTTTDIPEFNELGLWSYNDVFFSKYDTLSDTVQHFIDNSEKGFSARELDDILRVSTKEALLNSYKKGLLLRKKISGNYYYFSSKALIFQQQVNDREATFKSIASTEILKNDSVSDKVKAAIILFFSILNEKQKRLYAGLESLKLGYGGDKIISELIGVDVHTVSKGRKEIVSGKIDNERIRCKGGGRHNVKKKVLK